MKTPDKLREEAEKELLKAKKDAKIPGSYSKLIHELQLYQIELKMQNKELRNSQIEYQMLSHKYFDLYNYAPVGYFTLDKNGNILDVNSTGESLLGIEEPNLINNPFILFIKPQFHNLFYNKIKETIETGTKHEFELELIKNDKKTFWALIALNITEDQEYYRITLSDITERKKAEEALRESEEFLDNIVENIPDMIFVKNSDDLDFIKVNKAGEEFLGHTMEELLGKNDYDIFPEEKAEFFTSMDQEVLYKKKLVDIPLETIQTKNLGERLLHTQKIPILDESGNPKYLLGISEDITQRIIAENKIKSSLKEKEILLQEVHHRVKNNMQIISSLLNLQKEQVNDAEAVNVLQESQNRVKSMALIHEKLYTSTNLISINLKEYIKELVSDLFHSYSVNEEHVIPVFDLEDIMLNIETVIPLGLIVSELVSNSLKYAFPADSSCGPANSELTSPGEKKDEIFIGIKSMDHIIEMRVSDNGVGFPQEFDFKNLNTLGLQLVKNLANQIDGQIKLDKGNGVNYVLQFEELKYKERI